MKAYVFINAKAGKTIEVVSKVQKIEDVKSVNTCWGPPTSLPWSKSGLSARSTTLS